ncbi:response regulator transcription factor [bacterium]|nr:response regulator transcription factor [bacterium]
MRIVIADDHALVVEGLRLCFGTATEFEVVAVAENGHDLLAAVRRENPDLAVIDISMPGLNGIDAVRAIKAMPGVTTRCLIMSMHCEAEFVREAFRAGAGAYIIKSSSFDELLTAARTVMTGRNYLSLEIADLLALSLVDSGTGGPARSGISSLTPRERQTFQLLAEGLSVKAIGFKLGVSHKTVHTYRTVLMQKLGCESIAELTKLAIRHGLTEVS